MDLIEIRNKIKKLSVERDKLKIRVETDESELTRLKSDLDVIVKAQTFLQSVAKETQVQLSKEVDNIVNLGLQAVFPNQYNFHLNYEISRGKTEARFELTDSEGNPVDPMDSLGGGAVDVVALSLRIALYALSTTDNVIILDEPCKFVSANLRERTSEVIKIFSEKVNTQIIMVTHIPEFEENANVIRVKKIKGVSEVI